MVVRRRGPLLHEGQVLWLLVHKVCLRDIMVNSINAQDLDGLTMSHVLLVYLSALLLENDHFAGAALFLNCAIDLCFGNDRASNRGIVCSSYEEHVIDADLLPDLYISKHFCSNPIIFDYLVLDAFNPYHRVNSIRMHWE